MPCRERGRKININGPFPLHSHAKACFSHICIRLLLLFPDLVVKVATSSIPQMQVFGQPDRNLLFYCIFLFVVLKKKHISNLKNKGRNCWCAPLTSLLAAAFLKPWHHLVCWDFCVLAQPWPTPLGQQYQAENYPKTQPCQIPQGRPAFKQQQTAPGNGDRERWNANVCVSASRVHNKHVLTACLHAFQLVKLLVGKISANNY